MRYPSRPPRGIPGRGSDRQRGEEEIVTLLNATGRALPRALRLHLERALDRAVASCRREVPEVTVRYVRDPEIRVLNRRWKKRDRPTDVLAFETGDVVVSIDTARRQAADEGHSLRRELVHLAVHGYLHLGGWDDASIRQRTAMEAETIRILDAERVR